MLTASLLVPLLGAVLVAALPSRLERAARPLAVSLALVPLALMILAWVRHGFSSDFGLIERVPWIPSLGVGYVVGIDGISIPLAAMTALVFVVSIAYPVDTRDRPRAYYALMLFLLAVSLGLFLALDLFLFYVFFDLSLVGMYFLIAHWGHGDSRRSALKFFLYTLAGSLVMLLSIIGLYLSTSPRTFDMIAIIEQQPLARGGLGATLIFLGFLIGFGVKTPIVPLHTWLPPAHVDAPAPASAVLAGVLLKMGTYGFVRIVLMMMPDQAQQWAPLIVGLGVFSILYGALVALAQSHLKRLVAYSSINHMGYVILGIGAAAAASGAADEQAQRLALTGAVVGMVAHGLITGALFLLVGSMYDRAGTYEQGELGGLAARAPAMTTLTAVAAFASLGLPGLAGFVGEFQIFVGTFAIYPYVAAAALLGIVISAALFLRMVAKVFLGQLPDLWRSWRDLTAVEVLSLAPLIVLTVVIGVVPAWLLATIDPAVRTVLRQ